jgi:hypothetical protein
MSPKRSNRICWPSGDTSMFIHVPGVGSSLSLGIPILCGECRTFACGEGKGAGVVGSDVPRRIRSERKVVRAILLCWHLPSSFSVNNRKIVDLLEIYKKRRMGEDCTGHGTGGGEDESSCLAARMTVERKNAKQATARTPARPIIKRPRVSHARQPRRS